MTPTPSTIQFVYFAVVVAIYSAVMLALTLALLHKGPALLTAAIAFCRKTFTAAGDGCQTCDAWTQPVYCLKCESVRMLRPAEVLRKASRSVVLAEVEEDRRRREAFTAFEEIDLDLEESAVN